MSRLGRRRSLTLAAAALVALAAPAAAHAATYTVKAGDGPCGGADLACGGLVEAAAAASSGDVFSVAAGVYTAATFTTDVTLAGDLGFVVDGTLEFAGGGVSKVSKVAAATGAGNAPTIYVSGGDGLELSDSVVVSRDGFGVFITSGTGNKIVRSGVATGGQATGAIQVQTGPDDIADVVVAVESSVLTGGGAGIRALTRNNEAEALVGRQAGDIDLKLRHITAAGSTNGIDIDSNNSRTLLGNTGNITATVSDSIALNNRVENFPGTLIPLLGANTATLTRVRTLESADPATLFVNPAGGNYRLRSDATAAINQGGVTPGESATDIDGEDRSAAPTDLGADEYNNSAPTAKIALVTANPRSSQPLTFSAAGSNDREGDAIAEYRWRFSDGKSETTATPTVQHTFAQEGDAAAGLVVVDAKGVASPEVAVTFKLANGTPPAVAIVKPKSNQTFRTYTTTTRTVTRNGVKKKVKTRKRTKIQIAGLSKPASGSMQRVLLTIQKLNSTSGSKTKCRYYDAKKGLVLVSCSKPKLISARLVKDSKGGEWHYNVPTTRPFSVGSWKVSAYGVDTTGAFGNSAPKGGSISFKVKK